MKNLEKVLKELGAISLAFNLPTTKEEQLKQFEEITGGSYENS